MYSTKSESFCTKLHQRVTCVLIQNDLKFQNKEIVDVSRTHVFHQGLTFSSRTGTKNMQHEVPYKMTDHGNLSTESPSKD